MNQEIKMIEKIKNPACGKYGGERREIGWKNLRKVVSLSNSILPGAFRNV